MKIQNRTNDFVFIHGVKSFKPNEIREVKDDTEVKRLLRCPNLVWIVEEVKKIEEPKKINKKK